jgi:tetratricopeptide (TPR) repeat protein
MKAAKDYLEKAQRLDSTNTEVLSAGVSLLRIQARQDEQAGINPIPTLEHAVQLARQAREQSPTSATVNLQLLRSYAVLLGVLIDRGVEVGSTFSEAEKVAAELMVRYPDVATYPAAFGLLQVELANANAQKGKDPRPLIEDAIPRLELARRLNPQDLAHAYGVANARLVRAEYESTLGRDPDLDIQICKRIYRELTERESAYPHYHVGLVMALELEARGKLRKQLDPRELISEARTRLLSIDRSLPKYWMSEVIRARLDILEGMFLIDRPHDAKALFDRAGKRLDQLSQVRPKQPEIKMAMKYLEQARERLRMPFMASR